MSKKIQSSRWQGLGVLDPSVLMKSYYKERERQRKKEYFSMSGLTKTLTAVQKGNAQKRSIEPLSTYYQGNKYYYDHGHLITLSLTGCLCGRNATAEVSPLTLAGFSPPRALPTRNSRHWLIPCLPELTHSRKVNHTGVRSWCHSFCPITSMQSNNISAPL